MTATGILLVVLLAAIGLAVVAGIIGRVLVHCGMRQPLVVRMINRASERVVEIIKRPITVAVLDELADVLRTGSYTRNIAAALQENHEQIREMIKEKIREDPTTGRLSGVPFGDRLVGEVTETALRVVLAVLADPRTDALVSDMLRDNIDQIRRTVRQREDADASL
ncbi:MAG: hypothetical protein EPN43_09980 [Jatrophihabitans sp.]|nr:MAG: hypothetical protein EPN43_09980 [Jatrophihabitans sp.]